jgi:hypothetical protein
LIARTTLAEPPFPVTTPEGALFSPPGSEPEPALEGLEWKEATLVEIIGESLPDCWPLHLPQK